ncbi:uncharacterized protein DNG_04192 [Cephalotrichum gorgonifer]|uniref:Uncharacterized protein n=1 Tax=Cephalotrichum gorgonifer TaxID=2041049 RepID=A0AAE8MWD1_9PEZI|nr:uncharacterized protein DNG_04192 [Cephalotrichum gorgonifer]
MAAPFNMYDYFDARVDPGKSRSIFLDPKASGPGIPPPGNYWVAYSPEYTGPSWTGPVNGDALSKLRPALIADDYATLDENQNLRPVSPTDYAKRWGLHEDGPEGRSHTSPTRSHSRVFEKGAVEVTGKWLADYFQRTAAQENMNLKDWLENSLPKKALNEDDKVYLDWLDELLGDEVWQAMLFNDFTMDELVKDDVFTMRQNTDMCNLKGPLHPIVARERWKVPAVDYNFGNGPTEPRWFYSVLGVEGEYDPKNNDEIWEAIMPALLLVSKVLKEKPEFLNAILRVWNHKRIPDKRDTRPTKGNPLKTFDTVPTRPDDPEVLPGLQFLRNTPTEFVDRLWDLVAQSMSLHILGNTGACAISGVRVVHTGNNRTIQDPTLFRYGQAILDHPVYDADDLFIAMPVGPVSAIFQEAFWENAVKVYGLNALRVDATSHKMKATMGISENRTSHRSKFYAGLEAFKGRIDSLLQQLTVSGYHVAFYYVSALMVERIRLPITILRWTNQWKTMEARAQRIARDLWTARAIAMEIHTYNVSTKMQTDNAPEANIEAFITDMYGRWTQAVTYLPGGRPPRGSEELVDNGPSKFVEGIKKIMDKESCHRYLACLPAIHGYLCQELQRMEHGIFDVYSMGEYDAHTILSRFRLPWLKWLHHLTTLARSCIGHMSVCQSQPLFQDQHAELGRWTTKFLELANQYTFLKGYLTSDQKRLNPVMWRRMFLTVGRGNAARKTPSKRWAGVLGHQISKLDMRLRAEFEEVVKIIMSYSNEAPPHTLEKMLRDQGSSYQLPPHAPGAFTDLLRDLDVEPQGIALDSVLELSRQQAFNPHDAGMLRNIAHQIGPLVQRRQETRARIHELEKQLGTIQTALHNHDPALRSQQAFQQAQERRAELENQIHGLQQLQLQHQYFHEKERVHQELNNVQAMLQEQLDEVNLREMRMNELQENPAVVEAREERDRNLQAQIERLQETERAHDEQVQRSILQESGAGAQPTDARWSVPPPAHLGMLPENRSKRAREEEAYGQGAPAPKRRRLRTEVLQSLIDRPPFLGGPTGVAGGPRPLNRSVQLRTPHGGPAEVRYEVAPLEVQGRSHIEVVESMVNAVERWEEMGARQHYEVPRGAVGALAAVAGSTLAGLPTRPEGEWEMDWRY